MVAIRKRWSIPLENTSLIAEEARLIADPILGKYTRTLLRMNTNITPAKNPSQNELPSLKRVLRYEIKAALYQPEYSILLQVGQRMIVKEDWAA